ncbi:MAG TPA: branched-chain amino acid ABC transporter permease [Xanthobacteraceae bacterium]|nr:branched-chain amino acid ABC transporter permease [Xanthobacteraceae bacterium]
MQVLFGQLLVGLINGSFYALLALGFAIIFGLLGIINVAQGTFYMIGAFSAWMLLNYAGIGYWPALVLSPLITALIGMAVERALISRIYKLDHIYGLLLTYGLMMFIMGTFIFFYATAGRPYPVPADLLGGYNLGFMFLPKYRAWVVVVSIALCVATWFVIEKTPVGRNLRAATENPMLTRAFGINVPALLTFGFGLGVALAGLAGVLAGPIYTVSPLMGGELVIVVFAIVVVGGMQSIFGAVVTGLSFGVLEGLTKVVYPKGSNLVIFIVMFIVLLVKPAGLFGQEK